MSRNGMAFFGTARCPERFVAASGPGRMPDAGLFGRLRRRFRILSLSLPFIKFRLLAGAQFSSQAGTNMASFSKSSTRIFLGFTAVILIMLGMTIFSVSRVARISDNLETVSEVNVIKERYAINLRVSVKDRSIRLRDLIMAQGQQDLDKVLENFEKDTAFYAEFVGNLDDLLATLPVVEEEERRLLAGVKEIEARTLPLIDTVIQTRKSGKIVEAERLLMTRVSPLIDEWMKRINDLLEWEDATSKKISDNAKAMAGNFAFLMGSVCAAAFALAGLVAWGCLHALRPLTVLTDLMSHIARGDLSRTVPYIERKNEIGDIARAVQFSIDSARQPLALEAEAAERNCLALARA